MAKFISIPTQVTGQPNLVFNTDNIATVQAPAVGTTTTCAVISQGKLFNLTFSGKTTSTQNANAIAGALAITNSIVSASPAPIASQPGFNAITVQTPGNLVTMTGASGSTSTITVASTAGLVPGMLLAYVSGSGGGFTAGTTVASITNSTTFVASAAPSATLVAATITASTTITGTTITVNSTSGLNPGMSVAVTSGTGAFSANTVIETIASATTFTVNAAPSVGLLGATISAATLMITGITPA